MESVLPALGLTPSVSGVITGMKYATYIGKKSYDVVKMATGGGTGVRELKEGIVKKGITGSGVAPLVGSNKIVVGSAKKLPENKSMQPSPPRTPAKRKPKGEFAKTRKNKKQKTKQAAKKAVAKLEKLVKGVSQGRMSGRMKKQKSVSFSQFGKLGYVVSTNLVGTVVDPTCVYIYHSTYDINAIARSIIGALLRKLFKKAGIDVGNENDEFQHTGFANSDDFQLLYNDKDQVSGASQVWDYAIPGNTTFKTLLDTVCVYSGTTPYKRFIDFMFAGVDANTMTRVPHSFTLLVRDKWQNPQGVIEYAWRTHTHLNLSNERILMHCRSVMTVQNRTKGSAASATDYSDQRVDNQPLQGKLYEFKNGDPRLRSSQMIGTGVANNYDFLINTGASSGVRAFGSTAFPTDYMDEPPGSKLWKNVKKTNNVVIQPGDIKKSTIDVKYDLPLHELMYKFRVVTQGTVSGTQAYTGLKSHKSEILALEEVLRTPQDNFITTQYECEAFVGAYAYSKKNKSFFRTQNFEGTVTQWVPPQ